MPRSPVFQFYYRTAFFFILALTLSVSSYGQVDPDENSSSDYAQVDNSEGPFTGGVFDREVGEPMEPVVEEWPERPELIVDDNADTNQVVVLLNLDDSAVTRTITGSPVVFATRGAAESAVIDAINTGQPTARQYFLQPDEAWHLIWRDRVDDHVRESFFEDDDPEEVLHQYIVLSYPGIAEAKAAVAALRSRDGVRSAHIDKAMEITTPPSPDRPIAGHARGGNGVFVDEDPYNPDKQITIIPESPEPYQAFRVDFVVLDETLGLSNYSIDINMDEIDEGVIFLEYVHYEGFRFPVEPVKFLSTVLQGLPPGEYVFQTGYRDSDDTIVQHSETTFTVADQDPTQQAYTFFHPEINHYFVTADDYERDLVLADEWHYADEGFNVWPADGPAPDAATPVCRFYSDRVNSHFYTGSEEECDYLQSFDSGWQYEGIAFRALLPSAGACLAGTDAVWRLYNDRAAQRDSNHRFVVSSETYRTMIADDWVGEGVAFCSPPTHGE